MRIDLRDIHNSLVLPDNRRVILLNWSVKGIDTSRNVFLLDNKSKVIWQIRSDSDSEKTSGPFTKLCITDGRLRAYRWDGGMYDIDGETGFATPAEFLK